MDIYGQLIERKSNLAVVGLGYVGIPIAVAFAKKINVIGIDLDKKRIMEYKSGIDSTKEVGDKEIKNTTVEFTSDPKSIEKTNFIIVAVPTPINQDKTPDLTPVKNASKMIGENLAPDTIIVFESTVYPGVTENICTPIIEKVSGLKCGIDFKVGYSPERINPGDKIHRLENIIKIISGMDDETLEQIKKVYDLIIKGGTYSVSNIKTAEAIKVVENSQRDINIAFMNELAMVFDRMDIDTNEVIAGMDTKWNSLGFHPGLVGGHCIGVDPYYFIYQAERLGYHSQIILAGRKVNDGMSRYIVDATIKQMILAGKNIVTSKVAIFGITFKENCPDMRNSKIYDIIEIFKEYGIKPEITDPWVDVSVVEKERDIHFRTIDEIVDIDCLILAVAHDEFKYMSLQKIESFYKDLPMDEKVLIDIKGVFNKDRVVTKGFRYWRL